MILDNDCLVPQILEDKFGVVYWIYDLFTDTERWCFSEEDSFLNVEMDTSMTLLLIAGCIMCCAGITFCFVMNYFVPRSLGGTIRKKLTKKQKCCKCPCANK